eukprot:COSAG03_NODE_24502_length_272_cov_0.549133_1_plen_42_part_01
MERCKLRGTSFAYPPLFRSRDALARLSTSIPTESAPLAASSF